MKKFDVKKAKSAGIQTAAVAGGFIGGHMVAQKLPESVAKFRGLILVGAGIIGSTMLTQESLKDASIGVAASGVLTAANDYAGPRDETATGLKASIQKLVPSLGSVDVPALPAWDPYASMVEAPRLSGYSGYQMGEVEQPRQLSTGNRLA